ncbi:hypothetical protein [Oharaeibacter diazotrophicus]|uniref:Uncharacterized protein n=1 Tax=Oharaeibacter diazotrophicus TaxID=1920512 RepID=A0A4R6RF05_9HYPH|nr:hypothetical protein [Oharaeibacter diazotrophicus]TDP84246.1 hypothetical protein EDD54_2851 [Oharaeibacter diazotrophicus]
MPRSKQPGLNGRQRNDDGQTRAKRGDTLVRTLRGTYGSDFAEGRRADMRLDTLLEHEGVASLNDLLEGKGKSGQ